MHGVAFQNGFASNASRTFLGASASICVDVGGKESTQGPNVPCAFCRIQVLADYGPVRVRLNGTCSEDNGVELPESPVLTPYLVGNLNMLNFYSAEAALVNIEVFN